MKTLLRSVLGQTVIWRALRQMKRAVTRAQPAPPADPRDAVVTWLNPPPAAEAKAALDAKLRVEHVAHPAAVRCRWLTRFGTPFDAEPTTVPLPRPPFPHASEEVTVRVPTPDVVGDFTLEIDLVRGGELVEAARGVRVGLPVVGPRATDIDYHSVYRTANLDENHWWVVGAYHSKAEYEKSSRERLGMLTGFGLTPDSHVLDVGCGTGQMAGAMLDYLTPRGRYAGTDIGVEAIRFCNRTFRRPNFAFEVGGLTTVPFAENGTFDLAIFFSVFTHTFADETALLLAEAKRLLKPGGVIIADVITSELVERGAGHRGEMVVNKDHFLRLAAMLGYTAEVLGRWPWNRHAERFMFKLRPQ
jgi:SAM-dependent methyltransferase